RPARLLPVGRRLAAGPGDRGPDDVRVRVLADDLYAPVGHRGQEVLPVRPAQRRQRPGRVERQLVALRPGDRLAGLDEEDRVRGAVRDLRRFDWPVEFKEGPVAVEDAVTGERLTRPVDIG